MKEFFEKPIILNESIAAYYVAPGTGTPVHRNRYAHGIVYYPADSCVFSFINGEELKTKQGSILYLPKGANYNVQTKKEKDIGCWCINFFTLSELDSAPFVLEFRSYEKLQNLFVAAYKISRERRTAFDPKLRSIFYEIVGIMETEFNQKYIPSSKAKIIEPAVDFIKKNCFDKAINIDDLSALCGVSSTYFRRVFAECHGVSPVKYINSFRISRAKELIISENFDSIEEIARLCGFSDDCYFRKVFKAETLMTPKEFARVSKIR